MMKKIIGLVLVIAMLFGGTTAFAADTDTPSKWAQEDVKKAIELGIVPSRLQSDYQKAITREEFAELVVSTIFTKLEDEAIVEGNPIYWTPEQVLSQVDLDIAFEDANQEHVKLAYILGSVNGVSDTKFAPDALITRQEAATMLINTSHLNNNINYLPESRLNYSDFKSIAEWAKPAVQAASSVGFMQGVGDKFDYKGNFTREQSISTMIRLYKGNYRFGIRGNIVALPEYKELRYNVGKNYVNVSFHDDNIHDNLETNMYSMWHQHDITTNAKDDFSMSKAIVLFAFGSNMKVTDFTGIVNPTLKGQTSKWDYGYMTVTTFTTDSVIRFDFKPIKGYMTLGAGYKFGYPFERVTVTEIKNH